MLFMGLAAESPFEVSGDIQLGLTHTLQSTGQDDIRVAGLNFQGPIIDGFQPGTAPSIQDHTRNGIRPVCVKNGHPRPIGALAVLISAGHDDIFDQHRIYPGPFNRLFKDQTPKTVYGNIFKRASLTPDGGANTTENHHVFH